MYYVLNFTQHFGKLIGFGSKQRNISKKGNDDAEILSQNFSFVNQYHTVCMSMHGYVLIDATYKTSATAIM